ncbi:MAG: AAA family ATPase [Actinomycetota bacterium]
MSEEFLGLEEINIRNLGVIESANIEFKPGLNVLTGETGAGKNNGAHRTFSNPWWEI